MTEKTEKRRRTCFDRLRYRLQQARRARREASAAGVVAQLTAIFAALVFTMPLPAVPAQPAGPSPALVRRRQMAEMLGVPVRYVDKVFDGKVPFVILFADIRATSIHGVTSKQWDALTMLKRVVPDAADWIDNRAFLLEWSDVTKCFRPGEAEDLTISRLVAAAGVWRATKTALRRKGAGHGLKPGLSSGEPDGDDEDVENGVGGVKLGV